MDRHDIKPNGYYTITKPKCGYTWIFKDNGECNGLTVGAINTSRKNYYSVGANFGKGFENWYGEEIIEHASSEEKQWLDSCIKANKFIPLSDIDTEESLLEEAKRRYPIGTEFKAANNSIKSKVTSDDYHYGNNENIYFLRESNSCVYYKGKWAEIVEPEEHIFEVGDEVEIIRSAKGSNLSKLSIGDVFIVEDFNVDASYLRPIKGHNKGIHKSKCRLVTKVKHNKVKKDGKQDNSESKISKGKSIKVDRNVPRVRAGQRPRGATVRGRARRAAVKSRYLSHTASSVRS